MIENTESPESRAALLAQALFQGNANGLIEATERRGQQQLVNSDRIPSDLHPSKEVFEAAGFRISDPDPEDPLFCQAVLPDGWGIRPTDHSMHSEIIDHLGRKRVSIFYRASTYDRKADATYTDVDQYLFGHVLYGDELITDDSWATPANIAAAARKGVQRFEAKITKELRRIEQGTGDEEDLADYTRDRDKYAAVLAQYENADS